MEQARAAKSWSDVLGAVRCLSRMSFAECCAVNSSDGLTPEAAHWIEGLVIAHGQEQLSPDSC